MTLYLDKHPGIVVALRPGLKDHERARILYEIKRLDGVLEASDEVCGDGTRWIAWQQIRHEVRDSVLAMLEFEE